MGTSVNFSSSLWRKSSRSGTDSTGSCVEVAFADVVGVRDSKNQEAGHLVFGGAAWRAFAEGVKAGR
jgi:Domain of unknown function (DUF397)